MLKRLILAPLAVAVLTPALGAQTRMGFGRPPQAGPSFVRGITFSARNRPSGARGFYLGDTPYFYVDYPFHSFAAESAPPQVITPQSRVDSPQEMKSEPLLIELRGNRYVRFGGGQKSAQREITAPPDYAGETTTKSSASTGAITHELPPAVLVYRDGRHEEVSDYAIVGAVMYARGDYWRNGYGTKSIQLSALNIPATIKINQENGVRFSLPAAPNEVVTRP